jgi:hypothetical protein
MHPATIERSAGAPDLQSEFEVYAGRLADAGGELVVAHLDWRGQNIGWRGDAAPAIYDWDSVAITPETSAVGAAAGMYTYDFRDEVPHVPTPAEVRGFVVDYAAHRPIAAPVALAAAATKMLGYAITEHRLDPTGSRLGPRSYRTALRTRWQEYRSAFDE